MKSASEEVWVKLVTLVLAIIMALPLGLSLAGNSSASLLWPHRPGPGEAEWPPARAAAR